jgi:hypothetical protein
MKYLQINLTKDVNDLYKKNNKPMKKEFEEDYKRFPMLMDWQNQHSKNG